jgi:hypothetical protein
MQTAPPQRQSRASFCERAFEAFCPLVTPVPRDAIDQETLAPTRFQRRVRWDRVAYALLTVGLLLFGLVRAFRRDLLDFEETFRPSAAVAVPVPDSDQEYWALRRELFRVLRAEPGWCGVAGPNVRVFRRAAVLYLRGLAHEVLNPSWRAVPDAPLAPLALERSEMCHDPNVTWARARVSRIYASFDTSHNAHVAEFLLEGSEAQCFQHFTEVFDGAWPCHGSDHPLDVLLVPRLPPAWS